MQPNDINRILETLPDLSTKAEVQKAIANVFKNKVAIIWSTDDVECAIAEDYEFVEYLTKNQFEEWQSSNKDEFYRQVLENVLASYFAGITHEGLSFIAHDHPKFPEYIASAQAIAERNGFCKDKSPKEYEVKLQCSLKMTGTVEVTAVDPSDAEAQIYAKVISCYKNLPVETVWLEKIHEVHLCKKPSQQKDTKSPSCESQETL